MDKYRYGLTSALELLLLVGQFYFSSVIHCTLMKLISIVCIMHTCQTGIGHFGCGYLGRGHYGRGHLGRGHYGRGHFGRGHLGRGHFGLLILRILYS